MTWKKGVFDYSEFPMELQRVPDGHLNRMTLAFAESGKATERGSLILNENRGAACSRLVLIFTGILLTISRH